MSLHQEFSRRQAAIALIQLNSPRICNPCGLLVNSLLCFELSRLKVVYWECSNKIFHTYAYVNKASQNDPVWNWATRIQWNSLVILNEKKKKSLLLVLLGKGASISGHTQHQSLPVIRMPVMVFRYTWWWHHGVPSGLGKWLMSDPEQKF